MQLANFNKMVTDNRKNILSKNNNLIIHDFGYSSLGYRKVSLIPGFEDLEFYFSEIDHQKGYGYVVCGSTIGTFDEASFYRVQAILNDFYGANPDNYCKVFKNVNRKLKLNYFLKILADGVREEEKMSNNSDSFILAYMEYCKILGEVRQKRIALAEVLDNTNVDEILDRAMRVAIISSEVEMNSVSYSFANPNQKIYAMMPGYEEYIFFVEQVGNNYDISIVSEGENIEIDEEHFAHIAFGEEAFSRLLSLEDEIMLKDTINILTNKQNILSEVDLFKSNKKGELSQLQLQYNDYANSIKRLRIAKANALFVQKKLPEEYDSMRLFCQKD